ncbi:hypothetical protein TanjilG_27629 [Lupinus angustifolius]|uniref:Uncharacterized protein n=1 Tax=Lupinus angustifolius TaxID=3871 RepID=A0A1J7HY67_LUPAN|nr:PREDICTED: uncharacterized protein LOC109357349 [Lupinus angustifolius]OIW05499.1 hypothetical protein TanjilG_27629 [Lupinus angustifolius]
MEMESLLPKPSYGGISRFLRRRRHVDGGANSGGKKVKVIRLRRCPHRYWRIKPITRVKWVMSSPLKMLAKLKNGYRNIMLRLEGYSIDEFEARLIYEISKTLIASHELYPM